MHRVAIAAAVIGLPLLAQDPGLRTKFRVKQAASGTVYLDGGSADGLSEGMLLRVTRLAPGDALVNAKEIGLVAVIAVASTSAACEVRESRLPIQAGDTAELGAADAEAIKLARTHRVRRKYAQTVTFTEGDPLEAELREYVPRPPLPEVNRIRGRIGFEQSAIFDRGAGGARTLQEGLILRADMTRIGGTYWNLTGYWHGRINSRRGSGRETLTDLLNRTYHIGLHYNNPGSRYVAGFGRFLLPWASSLNTVDGGYVGRRIGAGGTIGAFGGSTPDPTAWNYAPDRQTFGAFASIERGDFENVRYSGTAGAAVNRLRWRPERQFLFFENTLLYKSVFSIHHNLEADQLHRSLTTPGNGGPRLARSFLTVRVQPAKRLALDLNHNYFRGVPTFDTRLIGTGLLDQLLFQGLSGGFRYEFPYRTMLYANFGANKREQDTKTSLNEMIGLTFGDFPKMPFRVDLRYSRFNSSFGSGAYESISLSKQLGDRFRIELQGGQQSLKSGLSAQSRARYATSYIDYLIGEHYILGAGWTSYRGSVQNYDQMHLNVGYRF